MASNSIKEISPDEVFADYSDNWRQDWRYTSIKPKENFDPEKDPMGFYEDILLNGVTVKIEVVELSDTQVDAVERKHGVRPKYRVVRGHRRFYTVCLIRQANPAEFKKLSCIVYRGLSEIEELKLRFDAKGIEELNEFEVYKAIRRLYGTGMSQTAIGAAIGQDRNYVQDRVHILEMPAVVADNFAKRFVPIDGKNPVKGKDYVSFTMKDIEKLHKAWGADNEAGIPFDSANSTWLKLWTEIATKTASTPPAKKALSKVEMDKRSGHLKGCEALEELHRFYSGEGGDFLAAKDIYNALESKAKSAEVLRSEVEVLRDQIAELTAEVAAKDTEIASLRDQLAAEHEAAHVNGSN